MFGRISKLHAVSQTVLLIASNKDISSKTKIADNLVCIKNTTVLMQKSFKKTYLMMPPIKSITNHKK
ncbi:MAG: hypothetical protein ACRC6N_09320 [Plesiomonas sp.]|uniref:hypothetical protein n=1 Tax=Plesiomonas sp. TaxID=2486279 RepID=UPI003F3822A9